MRVCDGIDIHVAEAFKVPDNGHTGILLDALDQAAATARDDDVNLPVETGEHVAHSRAVCRADELDRVCREVFICQRRAHGIDQRM